MVDAPVIDVTPDEVEAALARICASAPFASSERLKTFLRFVVRETLAGRADTLKEYTVGVVVYERGGAFNPKTDSIVRTEARRLRARLEAYYQEEGQLEPIRIDLARGAYVPVLARVAPPQRPRARPSAAGSCAHCRRVTCRRGSVTSRTHRSRRAVGRRRAADDGGGRPARVGRARRGPRVRERRALQPDPDRRCQPRRALPSSHTTPMGRPGDSTCGAR